MTKTVAEVMTNDPLSVSRHALAVDAARIMLEHDIGSLPVVEDGQLLGIVTDRDLALRVVAAGLDPNTTRVEDVATSDLHPATPDDSLDDVYERMTTWRVRRLPVVGSNALLIGMVAQADLVHELKDKKAGQLVDEISRPGEPSYRQPEIGIS